MQGQPQSITAMPSPRPYSPAAFETLPGARAAMHRDVLDPQFGTLAHRLLGGLRSRSDHDRLDAAGDRAQVVVAAIAFHLVCVRVDGDYLVPPLAQTLIDDVAPVALRLSRDAGDGYPLVRQKLGCGFLDRWHRDLLPLEAFTHGAERLVRRSLPRPA